MGCTSRDVRFDRFCLKLPSGLKREGNRILSKQKLKHLKFFCNKHLKYEPYAYLGSFAYSLVVLIKDDLRYFSPNIMMYPINDGRLYTCIYLHSPIELH